MIAPDKLSATGARFVYRVNLCMCGGYAFLLAMIASFYQQVPHPIWAVVGGWSIFFAARSSAWCMAYRRHIRQGLEA